MSRFVLVFFVAGLLLAAAIGFAPSTAGDKPTSVKQFGATGDGETDDTAAIQKAVDSGIGEIRFPKGTYRITRTITVDLDSTEATSLCGEGTATVLMTGEGPAFHFIGTHDGTASPATVKPEVWQRQRAPMVDGLEIVGAHPQASGVEANGTMQMTITRTVVREARHGIHLTGRNRNVIISNCHLYDNCGVGVFLDRLNLHQVNLTGCHISYNDGGGVVLRESEIRNLHIGTCDIEGNMGDADSSPTANVWLDATGSSIGEVAITGCTIQHTHGAPDSANIRIDASSTKRPFTEELRHGNFTIADNVLSDVQVNIEVKNARAVTITGNTIWKGYRTNLLVEGCRNVVLANNVFDRNPRYHYGDGPDADLGIIFRDTTDSTLSGNHIYGVGDIPAAVLLQRCRRMNIVGCTIGNYGRCGLHLDEVHDSRVSDCLIYHDAPNAQERIPLKVDGGKGNQIVDNLLQ